MTGVERCYRVACLSSDTSVFVFATDRRDALRQVKKYEVLGMTGPYIVRRDDRTGKIIVRSMELLGVDP